MTKYTLFFLLLIVGIVQAGGIEQTTFDSPAQDKLYHELIEEFRCLKCQNQNLAASNADLAKDLREQTYNMVAKGHTREEIIKYMVKRYGDFVLYNPPLKTTTSFLWFGPFIFLLIGFIILFFIIKKKRNQNDTEFNATQQASIDKILGTRDNTR